MPAQYQKRIEDFDFDMTVTSWGESLSPGNEQRDFWGSPPARQARQPQLAGIKDPVVDPLIETLIASPDRKSLVTATHALDRVLLWKFTTSFRTGISRRTASPIGTNSASPR